VYRREDIDRVRAATNLIDLVAAVTTVRKLGRSHKAVCPFHQEKTASLSLDPAQGVYYCFGCQAKGDIFTFVQQTQGLDFNEAVEQLARQAGVTLTLDKDATRRRGEHERLVDTARAAVDFYHKSLKQGEGAGSARSYLRSRGYQADVVDAYRLGYSPEGGDMLVRHLRAIGVNDQAMMEAGLAKRGRGGALFDQFRGRLMFPIFDLRGDPVGFGGRALGHDGPKYVNSPDSRLYQKSRLLYGLHLAKGAISRLGVAVVVEGYTDVIGCHRAGVETAVATCGTALGEDHFDLLRRFTDRVVLAFDADQAGVGAALRGDQLETPVRLDLDLRVALIPEGMDPADLAQGGRGDELKSAVTNAVPLLRFRLEKEVGRFDLSEPEERARALHATAPLVAKVEDEVARHEYVRFLSQLTGVDLGVVERAVRPSIRKRRFGPSADPGADGDRLEEVAVRVLLANQRGIEGIAIEPDLFTTPQIRRLVEAILALRQELDPGVGIDLVSIGEDMQTLAGRLVLSEQPLPADPAEPFQRLRLRLFERRQTEIRGRLPNLVAGSKEHTEALELWSDLENQKRRLLEQTTGFPGPSSRDTV
jgi:DNA primase